MKFKNNTYTVCGFAFSTCNQGAGAPVIDYATACEKVWPFRTWRGKAIHLSPWRRDAHGQRASGLALFIGRSFPNPAFIKRRGL